MKRAVIFIFLFLIGFFLVGIIFNFYPQDPITFTHHGELNSFKSTWARGGGFLADIGEDEISISNSDSRIKFKIDEDLKVSLNPTSQREEYLEETVSEAEDCASIDRSDIDQFELQEYDFDNLEKDKKVSYFLTFNKSSEEFFISHLIIEK